MTDLTTLARAVRQVCGPGATLIEGDQIEFPDGNIRSISEFDLSGNISSIEAVAARKAQFPDLEPDQFWFLLRVSGYEQDVFAWLASLNDSEGTTYDPVLWAAASAKLEFAKFFERDHPLIDAAREAIGISVEEVDALWIYGAGDSQ